MAALSPQATAGSTRAKSLVSTRAVFRVGDWVVRPTQGTLQSTLDEQVIEPRVMELLVYLAEHADEIISADRLLIDIWKGSFYGDNPVHKCMAMLRRALGDNPQQPRYIETLRRRGYRMIAPVSFPEDLGRSDQAARWRGQCPYVGLRSFGEQHGDVYFGRGRVVNGVLGAVREQTSRQRNFLLVLGPSGIGKSSLLRAGVLPRLLATGGFDGLQMANHAWVNLAAARDPWDALNAGLLELAGVDPTAADSVPAELPADGLPAASSTRQSSAPIDGPKALVIDHLEALTSSGLTVDLLLHIDRWLAALAEDRSLFVFLLARSDAYPALIEALPSLPGLKSGAGHFDVPPVSPGEIAEMIRAPAQLAALSFEYDPETRTRLDDALRDAAAAHPASLPLLQYTLQALYERRDSAGRLNYAAYREIGGLSGAIASRAESVFQSLNEAQRLTLPRLLARLVRIDLDVDVVSGRSAFREGLEDQAELDLVDALIQARLIITDTWNARPTIAIAHDALLREWPRAAEWVRENRRMLQARARLSAAAQRWQQGLQNADLLLPAGLPLSEALAVQQELASTLRETELRFLQASTRRARRHRAWMSSGVVALLLSAVAALLFGWQASTARAVAEQRRVEAESLVDFLLDDLSERMRAVGRLELLGSVAAEVSRYLEQAQIPDAPDNAIRRARALRSLAEVSAGRGETEQAAESVDLARTLLISVAADQRDHDFQLELGAVDYWRGYLALQRGQDALATLAWSDYLQAAQEMIRLEPDSSVAQLELSYALNNMGNLAQRRSDYAQASELFAQSIALKQKLYATEPERHDIAAELADSISWLGSTLESQGQLEQAAEQFTAQAALLGSLASQSPAERLWEYRQTTASTHLGLLQLAMGQVDAARNNLQVSQQRLRSLVDNDPDNRLWQRDLAYAAVQLGWLETLSGRSSQASEAYSLAADTLAPLLRLADVPGDWKALSQLLAFRQLLAERASLTPAELRARLARVIAQMEQLQLQNPADDGARLRLTTALNVQARLFRVDDPAAANRALDQASGLLQPLVTASADKSILSQWLLVLVESGNQDQATKVRESLASIGYRHPEMDFIEQL